VLFDARHSVTRSGLRRQAAALLAAATLLLAGCALASRVGSGDRAMVRLFDADTGVLLELANESHPQWQDVYSQARRAAELKLVPDELLGQVLVAFEEAGFDELAAEGPAPEAGPGLDGWIEVRLGDSLRHLAMPEGSLDRPRLAAYARMKLAVLEAYQSVAGLQLIDNPSGHELFKEGPQAPVPGSAPR